MCRLLRYAMNVLLVRDHSEAEIRRKLAAYFCSVTIEESQSSSKEQEIEQVITYCKEHDWLDDTRFARRYIASRSRKGYGSQRIRSELSQKGIDRYTQALVFQDCDINWCQLAQDIARRKFGSLLSTEWKEKAKIQRYLLYRGFLHEEIQSIYMNFSD
ncbi:regulatory protein RecX [Pectobacteriaceae bacterium CE70]|nr:regulatory protein RecX [Pectobacteriaceae bacterium C52]WJV65929.1 regulatory protein RecX [Pectobacteriaceae bacterium CE70]WJY09946.1 regulatory protein RecX [Pectobacteriaceae bacterium C80]